MKKQDYFIHLRHPIVVALHGERLRLGLTQAQVAEAPGVTQTHVYEVESGKSLNPGLVRITSLAGSLGKDICLMDEEDYW